MLRWRTAARQGAAPRRPPGEGDELATGGGSIRVPTIDAARPGALHMTATPPPLVTGVDFVTIWTRDFATSDAFYRETLGLPCRERYGRVPGGEYETGNLTLQVLEAAAV